MASINAATAGGGGVITTSDATGNLNIQSGGSTVVAVTSAGATVTGTLAATGAVSGTTGTFTSGVAATSLTSKIQPITASVAASALTVTLNPTILDFRATPLTSGTINTRTVATAISLTVPAGAAYSLGTVSGQQSRLVLLALDNAGTVELAIVNIAGGVNLDETTLITTTAIGGGNNSASIASSISARTSLPFRVVGYVESTQATAGTWATAPSTLQGYGGQALAAMSSLGYGQTWQNMFSSRALATNYYNTTGKPIYLAIVCLGGSSNTVEFYINGVTVVGDLYTNAASGRVTIYIIIPPGSYYSLRIGSTIFSWYELR